MTFIIHNFVMSVLHFVDTVNIMLSNYCNGIKILTNNFPKTPKTLPSIRKYKPDDISYRNKARAVLRRVKQRLKKVQAYGYHEKRRYMISTIKYIKDMLKANKKKGT